MRSTSPAMWTAIVLPPSRMMRLLIDEDTAVQLIEPLRRVLFGHDVMHVSGLSWKGRRTYGSSPMPRTMSSTT